MKRPGPDEMTFLEHLEELRWRILKSLGAIIMFAVVAFAFADQVIAFLVAPALALDKPVIMQALRVSDVFMVQLIASLLVGLVLSSPVVIYQVWHFVVPALGRSSRMLTMSIVLFGSLFFLMGITFGYKVMLPFSLRFFTSLGGELVESNFSIHSYLGYAAWMLIAAGLVFQLPVMSFILTRIGLLTPPFLRHYRRYAFIAILIFSAILTPPDPLSQVLMAIPLLGLYEFSILISHIFSKSDYS